MQTDRQAWIDNAKAFAIFLVVMGHYVDAEVVKAYIYTFHMELFFFISGLLFSKRGDFKNFISKRFKRLLVPYFFFSLIGFAFFLLRRKYGNSPELSISAFQKFLDIFTWNEFWFLGTLFFTSIIFFGVAQQVTSMIRLSLLCILCTLSHYVLSACFPEWVHENLLKCFTAMVFYSVGYYLRRKVTRDFLQRFCVRYWPVLIGVIISNAIVFNWCFSQYGLISVNFWHNYFYLYFLAFSGIFISLCFVSFIPASSILSFMGANTIIIYLLDGYPPAIIRRVMRYVFSIDNFDHISTAYAIVYTALSITILAPAILIINKYFPFVVGLNHASKSVPAMQHRGFANL
jgi:acyltransferase